MLISQYAVRTSGYVASGPHCIGHNAYQACVVSGMDCVYQTLIQIPMAGTHTVPGRIPDSCSRLATTVDPSHS